GKPLKSLSQGEVDFSLVPLIDQETKSDETEKATVDVATIVATVKLALGDRVSDVRASQRLTDSAACLVAGGQGPDRELERLLVRHNRSQSTKPILELNMSHILVKALARAKQDEGGADMGDPPALLFEEAQFLDGGVREAPAEFPARLNRLIMRGLPPAV